MNIPMAFLAVIICLLAFYTMHRFIKRPGVIMVILLLIQLVTASITVFCLFENVLTIPIFELYAIIAGVVLPIPVIFYDHIAARGKIKKMGKYVPLVEKKEKKQIKQWSVSSFTDKAELWKEEINAAEVSRTLSVNDSKIMENIKKQLVLIQKLINSNRHETAAERYQFLFSIIPDSLLIAYNTGYLNCFTGKYREAYKILRKANDMIRREKKLEKNKTDNEISNRRYNSGDLDAYIQFYIGFALYNLQRYEHAIRHFQKVLEYKPDLTVAYKNIARAFLKTGKEDKAIEFLEKGRMDMRDSEMRVVLGSIYYTKGETNKALGVLDEAAGTDSIQTEALLYKGKAAIIEKEYAKAIECFKALIRNEPEKPSHYYHLALAQRTSGDREGALKTYEQGINELPKSSLLLYNAGTLLDELGKKDKAVRCLYRSIQGDEMLEEAFNYLGVLLGQLKRYRESVQVFEKGISLFDGSYQLYFNQGIVLQMARRHEDAADSFKKAYEMDKKDPNLINYYTSALLMLHDYTRAIRVFKAGISDNPDDAELVYGLSKVYTYMGEKDIAVDLLKKVTELDSNYLERIREDADFKTLYNHSGYKALMVS